MPSEYKPPEYKPPQNVLKNGYKPRAYIRDFTVIEYLHKSLLLIEEITISYKSCPLLEANL